MSEGDAEGVYPELITPKVGDIFEADGKRYETVPCGEEDCTQKDGAKCCFSFGFFKCNIPEHVACSLPVAFKELA